MSVTSRPALKVSGPWVGDQSPTTPDIPRPRPWVPRAALLTVIGGLVAVVILLIATETSAELSAPGGVLTFVGSATGLIGMYLALVMVLLISRIPFVERILGQDGLVRWHRWLAPWPISLIVAHAVFVTLGYAQAAKSGVFHEIGKLITGYPNLLAATVGLGLMVMVGIVSIRAIRSRLRRETWWAIHLYMYLALALSFAHVILLGPSFVGYPLAQVLWSLAWAGTAGVVLVFRFCLPVVRSLRYRLQVVEVHPEADGVVSVLCRGRHLDRLAVSGGQFFLWRFMTRGMWWQAHPYSLSALPRPPYLRLTVKGLGDHSADVARLQPGTKVAIEGPYGAFTHHARRRRRSVLIAGGIGVTALRALLEDLPRSARPVVIVRATKQEELALGEELAELARERNGKYHEVIGTRQESRFDQTALRRLVPDLTKRDVYVCGPEGFVVDTVAAVRRLGVPASAVHHEAYSL